MYQGTTPAIVFKIKGYDLTEATVYVSFKQGHSVLTKNSAAVSYDSELNTSTVVCELTQEETLAMKRGGVITQIRFIYENGQAYATDKKAIEMQDVIYPEVIQYGGDSDE
jgi:hypothetical protein